jgi:Mg2+-importing ATPase
MSAKKQRKDESAARFARWVPRIFGLVMLVAVVVAALHFSEHQELLRIAKNSRPWWLGIAILLQAGTYFVQGETWRAITRAADIRVSVWTAFRLSLAKQFIDQAVPSAGISGTMVAAKALEARRIPRGVVMASVVVSTISYHAVYVVGFIVALTIMAIRSRVHPIIVVATSVFALFAAGIAASTLALSGGSRRGPKWLRRVPLLKSAFERVQEADPRLTRDVGLLLLCAVCQLGIVVLDTATMWVLIRSLGETASPSGVFTSMMISSLFRMVGMVPGGLGTFEAASVLTLKLVGVPTVVALAATLLFRGLSYWLPMVPGLIISNRVKKRLAT